MKRELHKLIQIQEELYENSIDVENDVENGTGNTAVMKSESVSELVKLLQLEKKRGEEMSRSFEIEKQKTDELNQLLHNEKLKSGKLSAQCDRLERQFFEKSQQQKRSDDEIKQLRENNAYRREVVRLEQLVEMLEAEKSKLMEDSVKQKEEIDLVRNSLSDFMTENTIL